MTNPNDGGPAFPTTLDYGERGSQTIGGMTLRDWFAGQALAGLAESIGDGEMEQIADGVKGGKFIVRCAYRLADAMLAAREVKP